MRKLGWIDKQFDDYNVYSSRGKLLFSVNNKPTLDIDNVYFGKCFVKNYKNTSAVFAKKKYRIVHLAENFVCLDTNSTLIFYNGVLVSDCPTINWLHSEPSIFYVKIPLRPLNLKRYGAGSFRVVFSNDIILDMTAHNKTTLVRRLYNAKARFSSDDPQKERARFIHIDKYSW